MKLNRPLEKRFRKTNVVERGQNCCLTKLCRRVCKTMRKQSKEFRFWQWNEMWFFKTFLYRPSLFAYFFGNEKSKRLQ
jgi:hypothetical protein